MKKNLNELLIFISEDSLPIVLVDANIIYQKEDKGYQGHFLVLIGYDEKNVIVHSPEYIDTKQEMIINKELFEKARQANGTDEDTIIISRKLILNLSSFLF